MKGIIVEGVTGSGKSRLLVHLQRRLCDARPANSKLFLSEHYSERALEHARESGDLKEVEVFAHLHMLLGTLASLHAAKQASKFRDHGGNSTFLVVIERFLLGHIANMRIASDRWWEPTSVHTAEAERLYRAADEAGLVRVVLRVVPGAMADRVLSTRAYRGAVWNDFLRGHGDAAAIVARYERWQAILLDWSQRLAPVLCPVYVDVEAGWEDANYDALAVDLMHRFLGEGAAT